MKRSIFSVLSLALLALPMASMAQEPDEAHNATAINAAAASHVAAYAVTLSPVDHYTFTLQSMPAVYVSGVLNVGIPVIAHAAVPDFHFKSMTMRSFHGLYGSGGKRLSSQWIYAKSGNWCPLRNC